MSVAEQAFSGANLYPKAVDVVVTDRKASTSYVQRRLQIGYNLAASFIERMEREGIVGAADPRGRREILTLTPQRDAPAPAEGHNSEGTPFAEAIAAQPDVMTAATQGRLKTMIERIERLEQDKAGVADDLKEVYAEAKGEGFDAKIIRKVVRLRKQDRAKRQEEEAILDLYLSAIGEI